MSVYFTIDDVESEDHFINMSNVNAAAVLSLLDITGEDVFYGSLACEDIPSMRRRILTVLNDVRRMDSVTRESTCEPSFARVKDVDGVPTICNTPRIFSFGIDREYVIHRLTMLDGMFAEAQKLGKGVSWA